MRLSRLGIENWDFFLTYRGRREKTFSERVKFFFQKGVPLSPPLSLSPNKGKIDNDKDEKKNYQV